MNDWPVVLKAADRPELPSPDVAIREHAATMRAMVRDTRYLVGLLAEPVVDLPALFSRVQGLAVDLDRQAAAAQESAERVSRACRSARYADADLGIRS